ncbi:MAG: hypothetical protein KAS32_19090 [Candidatus Peribacteraceae bacterium]|nr:hypothetical protein [Candidatus Peribacteraceae bacterium]
MILKEFVLEVESLRKADNDEIHVSTVIRRGDIFFGNADEATMMHFKVPKSSKLAIGDVISVEIKSALED